MKQKRGSIIISRKGSALPMVIIVFLVVSILLSSVFVLSMSNTRQVVVQETGIHADYIARSGAEAMFEYLINREGSILADYDSWDDPEIEEDIVFSDGEASVIVEKAMKDGRKRVRITSVGNTNDSSTSKRAVLEFDLDGYENIRWSR